ncbi:MAG: radical SAM protein [Candidatus Omnitrophica bacterium]|nr:radical SAM protein [Candidatus Omnitrophota bacterium]
MENTFHIQWHITDLCNLRCRHCYQDVFNAKNNLPFAAMEKIFFNMEKFVKSRKKKLVLDITGGEPLLHKNWKELFSLASGSDAVAELGIITNGFFLDGKNTAFLERCGKLKALKISAEGASKKSYEFFRGEGTYEKFTESCRMIKERLPGTDKILMFTLAKENTEEITPLFEFMENYNLNKLIIERFIPWGRGREISGGSVISREEWEKTVTLLCEKCGIEPDMESLLPYRGFMVRMDGKKNRFRLFGAPCIVGVDGIAVMPDGTVFPCRRFPLKIGNLKETSLAEIWEHSETLKTLRNKSLLKGKCKECKISNCTGCRALAYSITGDFMEEDPLCLKSSGE